MAIGGAAGAVVGMAVGLSRWGDVDTEGCGPFDEQCDDTVGALQMIGYISIFGLAGMGAGGIVGAMIPGHRWETFNLPRGMSLGVRRGGTVAVQFRRSF